MWTLVDKALQIHRCLGCFGLAQFAAQCCKPTIRLNKEGDLSKHWADIHCKERKILKETFKLLPYSSSLYEEQHITFQGLLLPSGIPPEKWHINCYEQRKQTLFLMWHIWLYNWTNSMKLHALNGRTILLTELFFFLLLWSKGCIIKVWLIYSSIHQTL